MEKEGKACQTQPCPMDSLTGQRHHEQRAPRNFQRSKPSSTIYNWITAQCQKSGPNDSPDGSRGPEKREWAHRKDIVEGCGYDKNLPNDPDSPSVLQKPRVLDVNMCTYLPSFLAAGCTTKLISPIYSYQNHLTLPWSYSFKLNF